MSRILLLLLIVPLCWAHSHSHEPAHYKYTKEANEALWEEEEHGHHHSHGHDDHGHSHEGHDEHAHSHGHEADHGDHGHSHEGGGCPYAKKEHESHGVHETLQGDAAYTGWLSFMNNPRSRLWTHALGATLLISVAPFIILFFIPINANTSESGPLLKVLLAFGSGGLLGDAFLHLIPHAGGGEEGGHGHSHGSQGASHGHSHSHGGPDANVGAWVLAGIMAFLCVERLVRVIRGEEGHGHSHGHSHGKAKHSDDEDEGEKKKEKGEKEKKESKKVERKEEKEKKEECAGGSIKITAYLNLVADFAHNFTDGLAIGASFLAGSTIGFVTMVTVLVHEVPHEIGDFAILIQSGYTRKKAMLMQLVTAGGALSGCVLSLYSSSASLAEAASSSWVLPFTAGGFIYIATVSVLPELLQSTSLWQTTKEMFAMFLGIALMQLISYFE